MGGRFQTINLAGGSPKLLCAAIGLVGATWNTQGDVVFAPAGPSGDVLYKVSQEGGEALRLTTLDQTRGESGHAFPHFLPDGRHFLYTAANFSSGNAAIRVGSLDSDETKLVVDGARAATYLPPGYLLYVREGTLLAEPFDAKSLRRTGDPVPIATGLAPIFSSSMNGVLAGNPEGSAAQTKLVWFDRNGRELGTVGTSDTNGHYNPWLSPDEEAVVIERHAETGMNLWIIELSRGTNSRFTFSQDSHDQDPVWAPDGGSIVYTSEKAGGWSLNRRPSSGAGQAEQLLESTRQVYPTDWSRDGPIILYEKTSGEGNLDVWLLTMTGDREPEPLLETSFDEGQAQFSSDGKWVLYTSNESGRPEVYVQTFPTGGGKWKISTDGGSQPRWRRDGKEVFYVTPDSTLMAVQLEITSTKVEAASPQTLFAARMPVTIAGPLGGRNQYVATSDGQRFLVDTLVDAAPVSISVLLNWTSLIEESQ